MNMKQPCVFKDTVVTVNGILTVEINIEKRLKADKRDHCQCPGPVTEVDLRVT